MLLQSYLYGNLCNANKCTENQNLCSLTLLQVESTIILETIFKLISCSYRDCICFEFQLIGSCKGTIWCIVHLSLQLFSAQKWCTCLPWALWESHALFSLCPHYMSCSNCYPCGQVSGGEVLRTMGSHLSLLHLVCFGSRCTHGCFSCHTWTGGEDLVFH